jgi:hypothetical protein
MVQKRKALTSTAVSKVTLDEENLETQLVAAEVMKKGVTKKHVEAEQDMEVEEEISQEEKEKRLEKEIATERSKQLKGMSMADLKELVTSAGVASGKKEDMIKNLLKHEAKARAVAREQKAKIRAVVVEKKEELEGMSITELVKMCESLGLKGKLSKPERIERLLVKWQEEDGVDKALARKAENERKTELMEMDNVTLRKLCDKAGVDPFVKEVLVERISKRENDMGRYSKASAKDNDAPQNDSRDMVEALLANESTRKKEKELKNRQEEEIANKRKELKAMSVEQLKKAVEKKRFGSREKGGDDRVNFPSRHRGR